MKNDIVRINDFEVRFIDSSHVCYRSVDNTGKPYSNNWVTCHVLQLSDDMVKSLQSAGHMDSSKFITNL